MTAPWREEHGWAGEPAGPSVLHPTVESCHHCPATTARRAPIFPVDLSGGWSKVICGGCQERQAPRRRHSPTASWSENLRHHRLPTDDGSMFPRDPLVEPIPRFCCQKGYRSLLTARSRPPSRPMADIQPRGFQPEVTPGWTDGETRSISSLCCYWLCMGANIPRPTDWRTARASLVKIKTKHHIEYSGAQGRGFCRR